MIDDDEGRYRAVLARDARFDGWFVLGVTTTGIYCRPSCPATTPRRTSCRFFPTAAAAQLQGFRACKRCRPDASAGSPEWNVRADLTARAMRLIADGVVDREGVGGLAERLHYSERHLHRQLTAEVGAGPLALARAQRAQTARVLIETTVLPFANVAFAAGFSSIRQFNDTVKEVFALSPTALREAAARRRGAPDVGSLTVRLPVRRPFDAGSLLAFLGARAVPGVEAITDAGYARTMRLPHGHGAVLLEPGDDHVRCRLWLADLRDLSAAVQRSRRLLDLDADPVAVDTMLGSDPLLAPLVAANPGRRSPGAVDGLELAVRAVVGQQISVAAARSVLGTLTASVGEALALALPDELGLTHLFPAAEAIAEAPESALPMPARRRATVRELCLRVALGKLEIDPGADRAEVARQLDEVPGVGPWTIGYIQMRALGDPDVFLDGDLVLAHRLEPVLGTRSPRALAAHADRWRPWRSYVVHHLWAAAS